MPTNSGTKRAYKVISNHLFARVLQHKSTGQKSVHAVSPFDPGDIICQFRAGVTLPEATYLTLQVADEKHITLVPEFLQYTNHSCAPTAFFDTTSMELVCIKAVEPGDELTFFYPSTEWEMAQPFTCNCGNPECLQIIQGAAQLSLEVLDTYRLTDFIRRKVRWPVEMEQGIKGAKEQGRKSTRGKTKAPLLLALSKDPRPKGRGNYYK